MMDPASGFGLRIPTMSGASTLLKREPMTGRRLRLMTLIDEFSRRCLAIRVARRINALLPGHRPSEHSAQLLRCRNVRS